MMGRLVGWTKIVKLLTKPIVGLEFSSGFFRASNSVEKIFVKGKE